MTVGEAVRRRILTLCEERNITINRLSILSGITQSTLNNIISGRNHTTTVATIKKVCDGLSITVDEFFCPEYFHDLEQELKILLLPKDPNDERNVIVEIRGGAGGEESALFSAVLFRMYSMYAEKKGFKIEIINANETEIGGYKEISFMIEGEGAYSRFKYESGVHRVQRVPETESQGRVHTSTTTVAVLPEAEDVELEIDPNDLKIDTFRSSGAGGQHINKTSSAIRITHLPTGMVVECQDERSQYKNKDKALKVLKSRLLKEKQDKQASEIAENRKMQVGTGDRSERIRTYNYPQGRVTDHRIGLTLYKLEEILNGNLDEVIDALVAADRAEKLKESMEK
mgnify:FL=1